MVSNLDDSFPIFNPETKTEFGKETKGKSTSEVANELIDINVDAITFTDKAVECTNDTMMMQLMPKYIYDSIATAIEFDKKTLENFKEKDMKILADKYPMLKYTLNTLRTSLSAAESKIQAADKD